MNLRERVLELTDEMVFGGPGSGWTAENGHVSHLTPQAKGEKLQKMGYSLSTHDPNGTMLKDNWVHPSGAAVGVSKYNAPNQPNLRKYEVTNSVGTKMFSGHQFSKVEDVHNAYAGKPGAAPVTSKPAQQSVVVPAQETSKTPSIPAEGKNAALTNAGFKFDSTVNVPGGKPFDIWKGPNGTSVQVVDEGGGKSSWQYFGPKGASAVSGKYASDLSDAIKNGGATKPASSTASPSKPAPASAPAIKTDQAWMDKLHQTVASLWNKTATNNYDTNPKSLYPMVAKEMGIPFDKVKEVAGKVSSWQGGITANDGNPIGEWSQQIVNGSQNAHPGMALEYAHTQEWIKQNGLPQTFYRGYRGKGDVTGTGSQVTLLNLVAKHSPEDFKINMPTYGAEGFSTSKSVANKFSGSSYGAVVIKASVDPKYVMTGKGANPTMWDNYHSEQEWALAFPKQKMPLDATVGDKIMIHANNSITDKIFWNALEGLKKWGWDYKVDGKEISLIPPPQKKDWLRQLRDSSISAAAGCSCGHGLDRHTKPPDFGCDERNCACDGFDGEVEAVSPPGWKGTVEHMKSHPEIDNPYALAYYEKEKGDESHIADEDAAADSISPGSIMRNSIAEKALGVESKAYKLAGYTSFQGLPISIENKKGSTRSGVNSHTGKKWSVVMPFDYGYIKGTKGADGQGVDVFLGPLKDAKFAYIVHQTTQDGSGYDEDKVFLGFKSSDAAKASYESAYDNGGAFFNSMTVLPMHEFIRKVTATKGMKRPGKIHAEAV